MSTLRFVTWNVHEIGLTAKKLKLFSYLHNLQADIVLLQEAHLSRPANQKLTSPQFPHSYIASYNSKQRGVAILINKKINFSLQDVIIDPEGRYVIIIILVHNYHFCITSFTII